VNKLKLLLACGALCATSQFALAGGPDMPPPGHSSIFLGIGGAYDYVQYKDTIGAPATPVASFEFYEDNNSVFGLSPVGQLGYEYFFGTGGFIGIKGLFNFVDKNTQFITGTVSSLQTVAEFQSMVQAMLEGGICINNNAFYLEGGYSALFSKLIARNFANGGAVQGTASQTLNGGVAGIGYRHYFWDSLFLDAVYSYSIYADGSSLVTTNSVTPANGDTAQLKRVRVQDIVLTVNYAFNF
jgi:outer membrane immunogenic protein